MLVRKVIITTLLAACIALPAAAADKKTQPVATQTIGSSAFDEAVNRILQREQENIRALASYTPIAETYVQRLHPDHELGEVPIDDDYFIGRASFDTKPSTRSMLNRAAWWKRILGEQNGRFNADGFAQMVEIDAKNFDRAHYDFEYVGREFLGSIRCIAIDVKPLHDSGDGRFVGRIWAEDQGYNIVRFNGTYVSKKRGTHYSHFDTWRLNMQPGLWLPAYVYSQETKWKDDYSLGPIDYRAQTRFWGYNVGRASRENEFSEIQVDTGDAVNDQSDKVQDLSPVSSQRAWQRQAEDNILDRLERAGLLAKQGEVDKVLNTVINNLIVTNNVQVEPEVRARVLLTSPIESFALGHTIIISRGLIDTLPDEASLAAVLAHELAHIQLDHGMNTDFAFADKTFFPDEATLRKLHFAHSLQDENLADDRALGYLQNSPYKSKIASAGLFLRQLQARQHTLPHLIKAHLGDALTFKKGGVRLAELKDQAPALEPTRVDQIAALPLGGRVKVDPWSDQVEMTHNKAVALHSAKEKLPLELSPFFPYLARYGEVDKNVDAKKQPIRQTPKNTVGSN